MVEQESAEERRKLKLRVKQYSLIVAIVAIVLAVWGMVSRIDSRSELRKTTTASAVLTVVTAKPQLSDAGNELVLPGIVQAYIESPIYARTNGYLRDLVHGHRRASAQGTTARGNRNSRGRPRARAGTRRPRHGAGELRAFQDHQ